MKPHSLHRLLASLYNSPHLILESALPPIVDYLQARNSDLQFAIVDGAKKADKESLEEVQGIGEIKVDGPISYLPIQAMCAPEGTSYQGILEQANELIKMNCHTIIMTHSSPGGAAAHCFSTCQELRELCDDNNVRLISYIDTMAASASLALSVIADEVIIHPSASTGSVGCVVALMDMSKAYEKEGMKPVYISSTPGKTPFAEDGSFSADFLANMQEDVTRLGNQFAQHVSNYTGISFEDVIAMDAKMFHAEKALEVGLVNRIMDHKTFAKHMTTYKGKKK